MKRLLSEVLVILNCLHTFQCSPALRDFDIWGDNRNSENHRIVSNNLTNSKDNRQGKVLNFFPIPVEEECRATDGRRKGICMNTYECRIQGGTSQGVCALGFGVCCVFTATCNQDVFNNITYFVNPNFPDFTEEMSDCQLKIKKIDAEIVQFRLDFIHFNLGQPNRRTGICEEDSFVMTGGTSKALKICGLNNGQHVYFDVENIEEAITINLNLGKRPISRLWEVRIIQVPFAQRAPTGCLQYHTGSRGKIQTMNFAENGRHLANQDYKICMRQEQGMCSIAYRPCFRNSFRIGPNPNGSGPDSPINDPSGISDTVPIDLMNDPVGDIDEVMGAADTGGEMGAAMGDDMGVDVSAEMEDAMNGGMDGDAMGEGDMGGEDGAMVEDPGDGAMSDDPGDSMGEESENNEEEAPADMGELEDAGSGDGADGAAPAVAQSRMMDGCIDRIVMPCESDDLLMPVSAGLGHCSLSHCGTSLCPSGETPCRLESSVTPFTIGVQFGSPTRDQSPEDNLGMCLNYEQLPCMV